MKPVFKKNASPQEVYTIRPALIVPKRCEIYNDETEEWEYLYGELFHVDVEQITHFSHIPQAPDAVNIKVAGNTHRIGMSFDSFLFLKGTAERELCTADFRDFDGLYLHDDVPIKDLERPSNFAPTRKQAPII